MSAVTGNPAESSIPQSGTDYSAVKNPYATNHLKRTYGDYLLKFLSMGAIATPWEKAEAQRLANYDAWESQHSEQQRQEMYNSALEQVEREREAGINPDLAGDVSAGESAEGLMDNFPFKSSYDTLNESQQQFSDVIMSALQFGMGALQSVYQIKDLKTAIDSRELEASERLLGLSEDSLRKFMSTNGIYDNSIMTIFGGNVDKWAEENFGPLLVGMPKRYKNRFLGSVTRMLISDYGKQLRASLTTDTADAVVSALGRQPVVRDTQFDVESGLLTPISEVMERVSKVQMDAYSKYNSDIVDLQTKVDEKRLSVEDAELEAQKHVSSIRGNMLDALKDIFEYAHDKYKDGNTLQKIFGGGFLSAMAAYTQGMLPNISFGTSESSNSSFRQGDVSQSSGSSRGRSFSFGH